jgi:uncharacterized protein (TIRG00374 family)
MKGVILLVILSIVILAVVLQQWVGISSVWEVMLGINPVYIPVIIAIPFLTLFVYSFRWTFLLSSVNVQTRPRVVFKYALMGMVFNNLTPMVRFGGEPVKGYLLAEYTGASKKKVFASLLMDSIITLLSLLGLIYFAVLGLFMFKVFDWSSIWMTVALVLLPIVIGGYVFYNKSLLVSIAGKASGLIGKFRPGYAKNLSRDILKFRENLKMSVRRRDILAKSLAIALTERLMEITALYIVFLSLGVEVSVFSCALVMGVGILAGNVPLLPGGLVAYESSTIFVLGLLGVPVVSATSAILLWRFASYWIMTFSGLLVAWGYGIRLHSREKTLLNSALKV